MRTNRGFTLRARTGAPTGLRSLDEHLLSFATFRRCTVEKLSFVFLQQLDLLLTTLAVSHGAIELNPLIRNMLGDPALLLLAKGVLPALIAWLTPGRLLLPATFVTALMVAWNVGQLLVFFF